MSGGTAAPPPGLARTGLRVARHGGVARWATVIGAAALLAAATPAAPQVRTALAGDTIRVGDVVPVAVRVTVDPGERVAWPDTLPLTSGTVENAARVRERVDTLADGRLAVTGIYRVTPWRTGDVPLPEVEIPVVAGDESVRTVSAKLPALEVVSVLPPDTAGIEPRPARGVIGPSWSYWPFLLAALALLALIAALLWWRRRRARDLAPLLEPALSPRERVLARLQEVRESGLLEDGAMKEFYSGMTGAVREYLATLERVWGEDLTSTELVARFRAQVGHTEASTLAALLRNADQVKFARRRPDRATAVAEWEELRAWVAGFHWPPPAFPDREAAA